MPLLDLHDLTDREERLVALADDLAAVFARHAAEADKLGEVSGEAIQALRESGLAGLTVPAPFGGLGASLHEFALVQERLGRADASLALIHAMNAHVLGSAGEGGGWPPQLYEEIARAASRGALVNSLASEPELGSPSRGGLPRTVAREVEGGWRVTGRKTWSTGAPVLDVLVVSAAVKDAEVWRFLIPADSKGVQIDRAWGDGLALRASGSHDVVFEQAFVPRDHAIAPSNVPNPSGGAWFWTASAATYLGVGIGALHALVTYARERTPTALGKPIATLPRMQESVGQIELDLAAAQSLLHTATRAWSNHPEKRERLLPALAGAKSACVGAAIRASDLALRAAGGAALTRALPLERFFRDARAGLMHPPGDEAALTMIGKARLEDGSSAFTNR